MRGRNTENREIGNGVEVDEYQGKQHVVLKFIHEEEHVNFNPIGLDRRKKEISDKIQVVVAMVG